MRPTSKSLHQCTLRDADTVMLSTWQALRQDFSSNLGFKIGNTPSKLLKEGKISAFRDYAWPYRLELPVYHAKCEYQLENFLKRYRLTSDKYTDDELSAMQLESQRTNISRLSVPITPSHVVYKVLQRARGIIKDILGKYDEEEHLSQCRFGKRSSVGSPYRKSYLDLKLKAPFEASSGQIRWFKNYLKSDILLADVIRQASPKGITSYKVCTHLTSTNVPKSYKSFRGITPNTTIGTFYTYGIGKVITSRLQMVGLNINTLQEKHGRYAKEFSRTRSHATADLSSASDSITLQLLMFLIPRKWLNILKMGQIRNVKLGDGLIYSTPTFCGMGIGFTFPLETLVFYGLLQSIKELASSKGFVSVYGDDLIYPSIMHKYVRDIFPKIGLCLNEDKTYVKQNFRESCGSDFYRGVDVRPVSPNGHSSNHKLPYTAFIYQIMNSLLRKWDPAEIPITLHYLRREVLGAMGEIFLVPPSYPDYSGLRADTPAAPRKYCTWNKRTVETEWWSAYRVPQYYVKRGGKDIRSWQFSFLTKEKLDRVVTSNYPYYWDALRTAYGLTYNLLKKGLETSSKVVYSFYLRNMVKDELASFVDEIVSEVWEDPSDQTNLRWRAIKPPPKNYRSNITGKRLRKLEAVVQLKVAQRTLVTSGAIEEWC